MVVGAYTGRDSKKEVDGFCSSITGGQGKCEERGKGPIYGEIRKRRGVCVEGW